MIVHMMGGVLSMRRGNIDNGSHLCDLGPYDLELTELEKELVRTTWAKLADKSDQVSADIFLRIFELLPCAKQFYPFRDSTGKDLLEHPYFRGHVMRFFNAIQMTIVNLDALEVVLIPNLLQLGQKHTKIKGFKHEYFVTFNRAMNDVFSKHLGRAYNAETRTAWTKIFTLITNKVEEGYLAGEASDSQRESPLALQLTATDNKNDPSVLSGEHPDSCIASGTKVVETVTNDRSLSSSDDSRNS